MSSRRGGHEAIHQPDIERRVAGMVRLGVVKQLDESGHKVRVEIGKLLTGWLDWSVARAGGDRSWSAPEVGEQVILAAPSGDLAQAIVIGSIYRDSHPAPGQNKDQTIYQWSDGAKESYDRASHTHELSVPAGGMIRLVIGGTSYELTADGAKLTSQHVIIDSPVTNFTGKVNIAGDTALSSKLDVSGDTAVQAITSKGHDIGDTHKHKDTQPGLGTTGKPL